MNNSNSEKIKPASLTPRDSAGNGVSLQLSRETIQELTGEELGSVWGGNSQGNHDDNLNRL